MPALTMPNEEAKSESEVTGTWKVLRERIKNMIIKREDEHEGINLIKVKLTSAPELLKFYAY